MSLRKTVQPGKSAVNKNADPTHKVLASRVIEAMPCTYFCLMSYRLVNVEIDDRLLQKNYVPISTLVLIRRMMFSKLPNGTLPTFQL